MRSRVTILAFIYGLLSVLLIGRLCLLALLPNRIMGQRASRGWLGDARMEADLEHFQVRMVNDGRGRILFRSGRPCPPDASTLVGWIGLPDVWPSAEKTVQQQGRSGLEATFDRWLSGRAGYVGRLRDARNRPVSDWNYRLRAKPGVDVRTTLDAGWQTFAQQALHDARVQRGAIVLLDARTRAVRAAVGVEHGHPNGFVPFQANVPGSVFKLVTAAAALNSYTVSWHRRYFCAGRAAVPGVNMRCWRPHGWVTLGDAIAQSCDATFAAVGASVGAHAVQVTASQLGLSGTSLQQIDGRVVLSEAQPALVFAPGRRLWNTATLANTAIGQEDVRISPLAAANIACTIAAGGRYQDARLIADAEQAGVPIRTFGIASRQAIPAWTAQRLAEAMGMTVTNSLGTGHSLARAAVPAAVKTGTAELSGTHLVNGWLVGYAPRQHPTLAFAVFVGAVPAATAHRQTATLTRMVLARMPK